jgi:thiosulfate/3-mercaptopyruvate sulfurtransferase
MTQQTTTSLSKPATGIVSAQWLSNEIQQGNQRLRIFDATYFLTDKTRDALQEHQAQHIHGAQYFDITQIADTDSPWPNTVPTAEAFEQAVRKLGVNNDHTIIAYDRLGLMSAARVWWLFRYFGHQNVAILDGGLPKWLESNFSVDNQAVNFPEGNFVASVAPELLKTADQVLAVANNVDKRSVVVDARAAARFAGTSPEPRPKLRSGHIPNSINLPFNSLLNNDHTFKDKQQIAAAFRDAGVDVSKPIITSCGSGVTACILALGLKQLGVENASVFDGSWTQWGSTESLPIATLSDDQ